MEQDRYKIIKLLGKGRTGGVYEAEDTLLGRRVALRRFFDLNGEDTYSDWEDSFIAIAQNLCALQHPSIATVFDAGVDDDGAYIVSQLLDGQSIDERLEEGSVNEWDVYQTTENILDALAMAHDSGFIHGAFNPTSIIRVPRASGGYRNYIVDLGLSRLAPLIQGDSSYLALMAEPTMMAPEQFDGSPATVQSDLYMVGQFAYICLVGGHPFSGKNMEEALEAHENEELMPLHEYPEGVSREFSDWIHSLIKINPENRPATIAAALESMPKLEKPIDLEKMQAVAARTSLVSVTAAAGTSLNALAETVPNEAPAAALSVTTVLAAKAAPTQNFSTSPIESVQATPPLGAMNKPSLSNEGEKSSKTLVVLVALVGVAVLIIAAILMFGKSKPTEVDKETDEQPSEENNSLAVPVIKVPTVSSSDSDDGANDSEDKE